MSGGGNSDAPAWLSLVIFLLALVAGMDGEEEDFSYPLFQTFGMFLGMTGGLGLHHAVLKFKIPFPGYDHSVVLPPTPTWMYLMLIFPSVFDLIATVLCMFGLKFVNVSIYQMLRGSAIVFVALLKQFMLGDTLKGYMWIGIGWNVVSIVLVGLTAMLSSSGGEEGSAPSENDPLLGVTLILAGALVQSLQYAFEEKVMTVTEDSDMAATPPLLLIGMEGFWGSVICFFVLYPLAYYLPGPDHGCIENPFNTYAMISNSSEIQNTFVLYFFSILSYNILACLVTFMLSSVWHAILDNFRPITVWGVDLFIFYHISTSFGESWNEYSWIQVVGMLVLLYGTAIYNAPNAGSIKLVGRALDCCLDFSHEYEEVEDAALDRSYAKIGQEGKRTSFASPHYSTMSPFMSPGGSRLRSGSNASGQVRQRQMQEVELGTNSRLRSGSQGERNYGGIASN